jgi:hypothetical protein
MVGGVVQGAGERGGVGEVFTPGRSAADWQQSEANLQSACTPRVQISKPSKQVINGNFSKVFTLLRSGQCYLNRRIAEL